MIKITTNNTQIKSIGFHKTADVFIGERVVKIVKNMKELIQILTTENVHPILSITWNVAYNAPVSVEKQNKNMIRRATKIAKATGRKVEGFDQVCGYIYGLTLTKLV